MSATHMYHALFIAMKHGRLALWLIILYHAFEADARTETALSLSIFAHLCAGEPSSGHLLATLRFSVVVSLAAFVRLFPPLCSHGACVS